MNGTEQPVAYASKSLNEVEKTTPKSNEMLSASLSRLPLETDPIFEKYQSLRPVVNLIQQNQWTQLPILAEAVKKATEEDSILLQVVEKIRHG